MRIPLLALLALAFTLIALVSGQCKLEQNKTEVEESAANDKLKDKPHPVPTPATRLDPSAWPTNSAGQLVKFYGYQSGYCVKAYPKDDSYNLAWNIVDVSTCDYSTRMYWASMPNPGYDYKGWFQLKNWESSKCLSAGANLVDYGAAPDFTLVQALTCTSGAPAQIYKVARSSGSWYQISDLGSGKCLSINGTTEGANLYMYTCDYNYNNQWFWFQSG